jgi:hypothetical protein
MRLQQKSQALCSKANWNPALILGHGNRIEAVSLPRSVIEFDHFFAICVLGICHSRPAESSSLASTATSSGFSSFLRYWIFLRTFRWRYVTAVFHIDS